MGVTNAPLDAMSENFGVEIKCGLASNGRSAQQWRVTLGQPWKAEKELLASMTKEQKLEHNTFKLQEAKKRKIKLLTEIGKARGNKMRGITVGVILHPDGSRGDVFVLPGFHNRVGWNNPSLGDYYIGTYATSLAGEGSEGEG